MKVTSILAEKERIVFRAEGLVPGAALKLTERAPLAGAEGRILSEHTPAADDGFFSVPRFLKGVKSRFSQLVTQRLSL